MNTFKGHLVLKDAQYVSETLQRSELRAFTLNAALKPATKCSRV